VPESVPSELRHVPIAVLVAAQLDIVYWHVYYTALTAAPSRAYCKIPHPEVYFTALVCALPSEGRQRGSASSDPALRAALLEVFELDVSSVGALRLPVVENPLLAFLQV
jgi:hypothetical protein